MKLHKFVYFTEKDEGYNWCTFSDTFASIPLRQIIINILPNYSRK